MHPKKFSEYTPTTSATGSEIVPIVKGGANTVIRLRDLPIPILVQAAIDQVNTDGSAALAAHVNNTNNPHATTKAQVGLGNADNTSDANKPVSTAAQAALNGKQPIDSDLTAIAGIAPADDDIIQRKGGIWINQTPAQFKTDLVLVKGDVGLGNVDNTSDINKPISTATQTAINLKATDTLVVHLAGTETITGAKTFSQGVTITNTQPTLNLTESDQTGPAGQYRLDVQGDILRFIRSSTVLAQLNATAATFNVPIAGTTASLTSGTLSAPGTSANDIATYAQILAKGDKAVTVVGGFEYPTDGAADNVQLQAALDAVHAAGGGVVEYIKPLSIDAVITLYKDVILVGHGDTTPIKPSATFSGGVALREQSGNADNLCLVDVTVDLSLKSAVGGIHIYQGNYVTLIRPHVKNQNSLDPTSKWGIRVGNYVNGNGADTASHGGIIQDPQILNSNTGTFEQMLVVNWQDYRITRPYFEGNTNSNAYELMCYINNKNGVIDAPHFENPSANSIGVMESDGIIIRNITGTYNANVKVVTNINSANVQVDGFELKNTIASPTAVVFDFFDRLLGPDGFTQLVPDSVRIKIRNGNVRGWKSLASAQIAGTSNGTDYTMNQSEVEFRNITLSGMTVPFNLGVDNVANNLHDWDFDNVRVLDWAGTTTGAWQLRGYTGNVAQMYGFRFNKVRVPASTGGGSFAAIRNIGATVESVTNSDFGATFSGYGALSSVSGGVFQYLENIKGVNPQGNYLQGNVTGATTFSRTNGRVLNFTQTGNVTATIPINPVGDQITLVATQDATGNRTFTFPGNVKLGSAAQPFNQEPNAVSAITLLSDGTNWIEINRGRNGKGRTSYATVGPLGSDADYITTGTSDEIQINKAIIAVNAAGGGQLFIQRGVYAGAQHILPLSSVQIWGEGMATRINMANAKTVKIDQQTNVGVFNLYLDYSAGTGTPANTYGVYIDRSSDVDIRDCFILNCMNFGIFVTNATPATTVSRFRFKDNKITGKANNDLIGGGPDSGTGDVTDILIEGNHITHDGGQTGSGTYRNCIDIVSQKKTVITGNICYGAIILGGEKIPHHAVTVSNNIVRQPLNFAAAVNVTGISVLTSSNASPQEAEDSTHLIVTGNHIYGGQIYMQGQQPTANRTRKVIIANNTIFGVTGATYTDHNYAINLNYMANVTVHDNIVDNATYGIYINDIQEINIHDNKFLNCATPMVKNSTITQLSGRNNLGINPDVAYSGGNASGALTITRVNGRRQAFTLTGNITVTMTDALFPGEEMVTVFTQDATGNRTLSLPANAKPANGLLVLSTAAAAVDTIVWVHDGTNWVERSRSMGRALSIAEGGTGSGTAAGARTNLSLYSTTETDTAITTAITAQKGAANGIATLGSDSKIPAAQLPALAITSVFPVANQAAQLALTAQEGDVAVRSDLNKSYIKNSGTSGTMSDWNELLTPTDTVLSVNGQTGVVVLTTTNIAEGTNLYHTDARVTAVALALTGGTMTGNLTITNAQPTINLTESDQTGPAGVYKIDVQGDAIRIIRSATVLGSFTTSGLALNTALTVPNGGTGAVTLTGLVKGNGTGAMTAAVAGTDYLLPTGNGSALTGITGSQITGNIAGNAANVTGIVAIANGGTGSATKNFVDLTTTQVIAGAKTFSGAPIVIGNSGGDSRDALNVGGEMYIGPNNGNPSVRSIFTGKLFAFMDSTKVIKASMDLDTGALTLGVALTVANGGTGATTASAARTSLGVAIGTDVQAYSASTTILGNNVTGTGSIVLATSPTIVTPTIASFANANHNHTNAAGGGQITDAALSSAVTVAKGGTGATTASAARTALGVAIGTDVQAYSSLLARQAAAPQPLTDAATIATDASLGTTFRVTLGGNRTLGNPTNLIDGQKIMYEIIQDATGNRTLALDTNFQFSTDIPSITLSTTAAKRDFMLVQYNSTTTKLTVLAFVKGF